MGEAFTQGSMRVATNKNSGGRRYLKLLPGLWGGEGGLEELRNCRKSMSNLVFSKRWDEKFLKYSVGFNIFHSE